MDVSVIMKKDRKAQHYNIDSDIVTIGRSSENDIQISDKYISREHLRIRQKGDKFFVRDLGSENGTFVNGIQIPLGINIEVAKGTAIITGMSVIFLGEGDSGHVFAFLESIGPGEQSRDETGTIILSDTLHPE
ncbi:MAG: FHA domain-containing protein [Deltaproteobacteria bacterium]|nr:FHA domain-containing protein [Deltaproteobacteria bacterium]